MKTIKLFITVSAILLSLGSFAQFTVSLDYPPKTNICKGDTITITASTTSTSSLLNFKWSTGEQKPYIIINKEGTYTVTVTDENQNSNTATVNVAFFPEVPITIKVDKQKVCDDNPPLLLESDPPTAYIYGSNVFNYMFDPIKAIAGLNWIYCDVYHDNQCLSRDSIAIEVVRLNYDTVITPPGACQNSSDGAIELFISGGVEPYSYNWKNGSQSSTESSLKNIPQGIYQAIVTDALGCRIILDKLYVYPNYSLPNLQVYFENEWEEKTAPFVARFKNRSTNYCSGYWYVYYNNDYYSSDEKEFSYVCKLPGTYRISFFAQNGGGTGNSEEISFTFEVDAAIPDTTNQSLCKDFNVDLNIKSNVCFGYENGEISTNISGGTSPYRYLWSTTSTDSKIRNLKAGNYTVTVEDVKGCRQILVGEVKDSSALYMEKLDMGNPSSCTSNDGFITINMNGGTQPYKFLWEDGNTINALTGLQTGNYKFTVTDANNCIYSSNIALNSPDVPYAYISKIGYTNCTEASGFINVGYKISNTVIKWDDIIDEEISSLRYHLAAGDYMFTVADTVTKCSSKLRVSIESSVPEKQEICIVTVSPETGKNLVVWEPVQSMNEIDYYTIYKEDKELDEFVEIAKVPSGDLSVYRDENSDPESKSDRYKISATNYCGIESPLSRAYKTINTRTEFGLDEYINVIQDFYEGDYVNTYSLYASLTTGYAIEVASVDAKLHEAWITTLVPESIVRGYYIAVNLADRCYPVAQGSSLKTDSGPFSQSLSNITEAELDTKIAGINELKLNVSPNPSKGNVTIDIPENGKLTIISIDGKTSLDMDVIAGAKEINNLQSGVYIVKLDSSKDYYSTILVQ